MEFKRNNDLENVFNQRYRANHGNNEAVRQAKKDFDFKMFGIRDKDDIRKEMREARSVKSQVDNLNNRVNSLNNINNMGRINDIKKKF